MQSKAFSSLFVGQNLIELEEVDSTNNYLKRQISTLASLSEGTVVVASHQSAGRGQQGNKWQAPKGENLTFSILLQPSFLSAMEQFWLNKIVCLGLHRALHPFAKGMLIKWPNDLYHQDKKIGGVLIESVLNGSQIRYAIIGIGINVNQRVFPANLTQAQSLCHIVGQKLELDYLLIHICKAIEGYYLQLKSGKCDSIEQSYQQLLLGREKWRWFVQGDTSFYGKIIGTNPEGRLEIELPNGKRQVFGLQEIKFVF